MYRAVWALGTFSGSSERWGVAKGWGRVRNLRAICAVGGARGYLCSRGPSVQRSMPLASASQRWICWLLASGARGHRRISCCHQRCPGELFMGFVSSDMSHVTLRNLIGTLREPSEPSKPSLSMFCACITLSGVTRGNRHNRQHRHNRHFDAHEAEIRNPAPSKEPSQPSL